MRLRAVALSLVIVYKSSDVMNFAGGEMVMLGGYLGMLALIYLELQLSADVRRRDRRDVRRRRAVRPHGARHRASAALRSRNAEADLVPMVVATIGLCYVLKGAVRVVPYTEEVRRLPPFMSGPPMFIGDVVLQQQDIAIIVVDRSLVMLALRAFFGWTRIGKALRATSQNPRAAALIGIPVKSMRMIAWGLAAALAGIAGILLSPKLLMTPDMGDDRDPRIRGRDHRRLHHPAPAASSAGSCSAWCRISSAS